MSGGWLSDLQSLPPVGRAANRLSNNIPSAIEPPAGSYLQAVNFEITTTLRAALFGIPVDYIDLADQPLDYARHTTSVSYIKNNPNDSGVWSGSIERLPAPPMGAGVLALPTNFGIAPFTRWTTDVPINGGFPATTGANVVAGAVSLNLRAIVSAIMVAVGPSAGYPVPVAPSGVELEWEHPTPELVAVEGAADQPSSSSATGLVTWYRPDPAAFRPLYPGEAGAPGDALFGRYWLAGGLGVGTTVSATDTAYGPWGPLVAASADIDPATLPTAVPVIVAPPILRGGDPVISTIGHSGFDRFDQWLAVRAVLRARRYRFTGESVVRRYPRDDALGAIASPRVFPTPRRGRVFGGYR